MQGVSNIDEIEFILTCILNLDQVYLEVVYSEMEKKRKKTKSKSKR